MDLCFQVHFKTIKYAKGPSVYQVKRFNGDIVIVVVIIAIVIFST